MLLGPGLALPSRLSCSLLNPLTLLSALLPAVKYKDFLRKRMLHNPRRGKYHYKSPSRIFWRVVRGMMPHKTHRGAAAMARLKVFEGIPAPYDKVKRVVVPSALRVLRLKPHRKYCSLNRLSSEFGWQHNELVQTLEAKRKVKSAAFHEKKVKEAEKRKKAVESVAKQLEPINKELAKYGY